MEFAVVLQEKGLEFVVVLQEKGLEFVVVLQEKGLEFAVVGILERASAGDYIGLMARNKISIETLVQLTDSDLEQVRQGVTSDLCRL